MVLDSSAIVALVLDEPEAARIRAAVEGAPVVLIGAPTVLETLMVLTGLLGEGTRRVVGDLLNAAEAEIIPFSSEHAFTAHEAFLKFGKDRHPAALNYGDCMTYAFAKIACRPLMFVGSGFSQTDISIAT